MDRQPAGDLSVRGQWAIWEGIANFFEEASKPEGGLCLCLLQE